MKTAITASSLITPLDVIANPLLIIEDGTVAEVSSREEKAFPANVRHVDLGDAIIAPGYVDIHIHGAAGHDLMQEDAASLDRMEDFLARHGITSYLPTTVTASLDVTLRSLELLGEQVIQRRRKAYETATVTRAQPLGIHLEGPFISPQRSGVHELKHLLSPTVEVFDQMCDAAQNQIKMITIAPELEGAEAVIQAARSRGICVSLGHSDADTQITYDAIRWGATHATHTFNAMPPLGHREPGLLGVILSDDLMTADIIADGLHVAPEVVRLFLRAKGSEGAVLISDAMSGTGMPDGQYWLGTMQVQVQASECRINGKLAGSVLTLDAAVQNIMRIAQYSLQSAVRLATLNPAFVAGFADRKGVVAPGRDADIVALSPLGQVMKTLVE